MPLFELNLQATLAPYKSKIPTRCMLVSQAALQKTTTTLREHLPQDRWFLVADQNTWPLAGPILQAQFEAAGIDCGKHIFEAGPTPSFAKVDELQTQLQGASALIAIGAGTINDIAKMAAHRTAMPYAVIATVPSMNGYTSAVAALLEEGVKTTSPCTAPIAIIADIDLLAQAPYRMLAAGLGDLLSKPVSQADWLLAHHLTGETYSQQAAELIEASAALLGDVPAHLPARNPNAVGHLMGSLLLSGLAMTLAGTSAPSSGGEHLISHYLDMTHYAFGDANDLHGCQVGVATLTTAALYEKLSTFDPAAIDIEACTAAHNTWEAHSAVLEQRFTTLASAVKPHAKEKYPTKSQLRQRLNFLKDNWREVIPHITAPLHTTAQIRAQLEAAQAPTTFAAVGATAPRARRAITHSKDIRARYTILHLLAELGLLEEWSEDILRVQKLLGA